MTNRKIKRPERLRPIIRFERDEVRYPDPWHRPIVEVLQSGQKFWQVDIDMKHCQRVSRRAWWLVNHILESRTFDNRSISAKADRHIISNYASRRYSYLGSAVDIANAIVQLPDELFLDTGEDSDEKLLNYVLDQENEDSNELFKNPRESNREKLERIFKRRY